jgi:hypothetical protein
MGLDIKTDWLTVSRNVTMTLTFESELVRTSGWGSLESETAKCGYESRGTRTWEWLRWRVSVATANDRSILSSERMLRKDYDRKCLVEKKLLVVILKGLVTKTNWLAVNRYS